MFAKTIQRVESIDVIFDYRERACDFGIWNINFYKHWKMESSSISSRLTNIRIEQVAVHFIRSQWWKKFTPNEQRVNFITSTINSYFAACCKSSGIRVRLFETIPPSTPHVLTVRTPPTAAASNKCHGLKWTQPL